MCLLKQGANCPAAFSVYRCWNFRMAIQTAATAKQALWWVHRCNDSTQHMLANIQLRNILWLSANFNMTHVLIDVESQSVIAWWRILICRRTTCADASWADDSCRFQTSPKTLCLMHLWQWCISHTPFLLVISHARGYLMIQNVSAACCWCNFASICGLERPSTSTAPDFHVILTCSLALISSSDVAAERLTLFCMDTEIVCPSCYICCAWASRQPAIIAQCMQVSQKTGPTQWSPHSSISWSSFVLSRARMVAMS